MAGDSIRDALASAFEADEAKQEELAPEGSEKELDAEVKVPTPQELLNSKPDDDKVVKDDAGETPAKVGDDEVKKDDDPKSAEEQEAEIKAPVSFTAEERELFKSLPAPAKKLMVRREKEYTAGIQRHVEGARFGESIRITLQPYDALIRMEGATYQQA